MAEGQSRIFQKIRRQRVFGERSGIDGRRLRCACVHGARRAVLESRRARNHRGANPRDDEGAHNPRHAGGDGVFRARPCERYGKGKRQQTFRTQMRRRRVRERFFNEFSGERRRRLREQTEGKREYRAWGGVPLRDRSGADSSRRYPFAQGLRKTL